MSPPEQAVVDAAIRYAKAKRRLTAPGLKSGTDEYYNAHQEHFAAQDALCAAVGVLEYVNTVVERI